MSDDAFAPRSAAEELRDFAAWLRRRADVLRVDDDAREWLAISYDDAATEAEARARQAEYRRDHDTRA